MDISALGQGFKRFGVPLVLAFYLHRTLRLYRQQKHHLQLGNAAPPSSLQLRWLAFRHTLFGQFLAACEFLMVFAKPRLTSRIARLLVWKEAGTRAGVRYGVHNRLKMDIYGVHSSEQKKPVLVFIHGGGWSFGHRWQYGLVGEYLASKLDIVVAVLDYQTYPSGYIDDMIQNTEDAIQWIATNVHLYGGDAEKIYVSGHSSGAHVGALTLIRSAITSVDTSQASTSTEERPVASIVKGFIGAAGVYDINDHYIFESKRDAGPIQVHEVSGMKPTMLGPSNFAKCSPTHIIRESADIDYTLPPFHLIHGTADTVVPHSSSVKFAEALKKANKSVEIVEVDDCSHPDVVFAMMGDRVPAHGMVVDAIRHAII